MVIKIVCNVCGKEMRNIGNELTLTSRDDFDTAIDWILCDKCYNELKELLKKFKERYGDA